MSKKLNRAVESLSIASLQLASAIENLSAIAREESGRAQHCSHPLSDMKAVAMSLSDFVQHCKDAEQSGRMAEEPNMSYGGTGDTYVGQTSDTYAGQTESSTKPPAQRISIPPVDLMAVSKGEVAKSQATSVETLSEATAQTETPEVAERDMYFQRVESDEIFMVKKGESLDFLNNADVLEITESLYHRLKKQPEVAEHAMYFQHNGSDSIFMVKKGDSLAFLGTDDVSEISKSQYHRLKKQQEADEAAAKLATDEPAEEPTDASDEAKNNAMFKLITKTLTQACNDTLISRVDIKKKLAKYDGATSISALTYDQKMDLWENWVKDFAEDETLPF